MGGKAVGKAPALSVFAIDEIVVATRTGDKAACQDEQP